MAGQPSDREQAPKVSVLLTTHNHERFVEDAIESVLRQDLEEPHEIVIADDASDDDTRRIVLEFALEHPDRIRLLLPASNIGMNPIFRQALEAARGEYIAFLDGDDYWTDPSKLRRQVGLLDDHPEWVSCFHDAIVFYEDGSNPPRRFSPGFRKEVFDQEDAIRTCFAPTLSVLVRRSALDAVPEWAFEYTWSDWLIHVFTAERGGIGYLDRVIGAYRVHAGGIFSAQDRSSQIEEDLRVYERLGRELPDRLGPLVERCVEHRRYQLSVEGEALPYDRPVVVVDPIQDMPLYFNGRQARYFPSQGDATDADDEELARAFHALLAEAASPTVASPHYRPRREPPDGGDRGCFVLVPRSANEWLEARPRLRESIAAGRALRDDEACWIRELALDSEAPPPRPAPRGAWEVVSLATEEPRPSQLRGAGLEAPPQGTLLTGASDVIGWVIAEGSEVAEVELTADGAVIARGVPSIERPDLSRVTGEEEPVAGFRLPIELAPDPVAREIDARAVLADGGRVRFGSLRLRPFEVPRPPAPQWQQSTSTD